MPNVLNEFSSVETHHVPPDPGVLRAIGLNHRFESAIADLVDNSLDAGATRVQLRFVTKDGLVDQILVIDNGCGMDADGISSAMQLGRPKKQEAGTLGYYGMGLKAASFSQASELTVLSRASSSPGEGRRMLRESDSDFDVEVLASAEVDDALDELWHEFGITTGTVVRWDQVRTFPAAKDRSVTEAFIESKVSELRAHLGLMFHRLLARRAFAIDIDVFDADLGEASFPFEVEPIDPFGYRRSGGTDYPKTLIATTSGDGVRMECHIWPGRSDSHLFKLAAGSADSSQGFFLYRHDRLLTAGDWCGVTRASKRRRLARVAIDIDNHLSAFTMSMEKAGVTMVADLVHAIEIARSADGTTFHQYLADAEEAFRESNRRVSKRSPILPPGQGISPRVKRALEREVAFIDGEEPLRIRWERLPEGEFLEVDRNQRTLWLNKDYREAVLKGTSAGVNDAPLVKALLFLLFEDIFRGAAFGPKDKDNVSLWSEVLSAAADEEWYGYHG